MKANEHTDYALNTTHFTECIKKIKILYLVFQFCSVFRLSLAAALLTDVILHLGICSHAVAQLRQATASWHVLHHR